VTTKVATAISSGDVGPTSEALVRSTRASLGDAKPELLVLFCSTAQPLAQATRRIAEAFPDVPLIAASTAGEFTESGDLKGSSTLFAVAGSFRVHAGLGVGLKANPERAIQQALEGQPRQVIGYPHRTAILLLDPLAGNGEETTLIAASLLGENVRLAGGAAGDDLKMTETLVGCGTKVASDAAVVAKIFSKSPLGVGVSHGHQPLSPSLKITRAEGNVVREIDGLPAWSVWKDQTRASAQTRGVDVEAIPADQEGAFLLRYEAGLAAGGRAYKIRAPLSRSQDGSISFACGIPEGSVIRITESVPERQVESAREAARRALTQLGAKPAGALVFDCICRNLILDRDFSRAVRAISEELGGVPLAGFETYGEIALDAGDMSGFHNTTSVVLAFPQH
jgi:methyl-accepting chemotaxis protein